MLKECSAAQLQAAHKFFNNTISCFVEDDSTFVPREEMYSVAQQIAHTAFTIDWFLTGAFRKEGFDLDFAEADRRVRQVTSLKEAKEILVNSFAKAVQLVNSCAEDEWEQKISPGPIMGGHPRSGIIGAIIEHSAHHRGSLAVYARLLGKTPKMPYS